MNVYEQLAKLANDLDDRELFAYAEQVDGVLSKLAQQKAVYREIYVPSKQSATAYVWFQDGPTKYNIHDLQEGTFGSLGEAQSFTAKVAPALEQKYGMPTSSNDAIFYGHQPVSPLQR